MEIKISKDLPPNYPDIVAEFPFVESKENVVYTYGDTVFNVQDGLSEDLKVHENTHVNQQLEPEVWWEKYLSDADFRLSQELEAYSNQYQFQKERLSNKNLKSFLSRIASDLVSPMYGLNMSLLEAESKIRNYVKSNEYSF